MPDATMSVGLRKPSTRADHWVAEAEKHLGSLVAECVKHFESIRRLSKALTASATNDRQALKHVESSAVALESLDCLRYATTKHEPHKERSGQVVPSFSST